MSPYSGDDDWDDAPVAGAPLIGSTPGDEERSLSPAGGDGWDVGTAVGSAPGGFLPHTETSPAVPAPGTVDDVDEDVDAVHSAAFTSSFDDEWGDDDDYPQPKVTLGHDDYSQRGAHGHPVAGDLSSDFDDVGDAVNALWEQQWDNPEGVAHTSRDSSATPVEEDQVEEAVVPAAAARVSVTWSAEEFAFIASSVDYPGVTFSAATSDDAIVGLRELLNSTHGASSAPMPSSIPGSDVPTPATVTGDGDGWGVEAPTAIVAAEIETSAAVPPAVPVRTISDVLNGDGWDDNVPSAVPVPTVGEVPVPVSSVSDSDEWDVAGEAARPVVEVTTVTSPVFPAVIPPPPMGSASDLPTELFAQPGEGAHAGSAVAVPVPIYEPSATPDVVVVEEVGRPGMVLEFAPEQFDENGEPAVNSKSSKGGGPAAKATPAKKPKKKTNTIGGIRLTARDMKIMEFLARYRTATVGQLARRFETSETALRNRLPLLDKAGLITWAWAAQTKPKIWMITDQGLKTVDMSLTAPTVSWGQLRHTLGLVDLGIAFELAGEIVLTEREIRAAAAQYTPTPRLRTAIDLTRYRTDLGQVPVDGLDPIGVMDRVKRALIIPVPGRPNGHTPDMILARQPFPNGASGNIAIELELSRKGLEEWKKILSAFVASSDFAAVYYFVKSRDVQRSLQSIVKSVGGEGKIMVELFVPIDLTADPTVTGGGSR